MIEIVITDTVPKKQRSVESIKFFIEKVLLPTINRQPANLSHNMAAVMQAIIEVIHLCEYTEKGIYYFLFS